MYELARHGDLGLRFALTLLLCVYGGYRLDLRFGWLPWLTLLGTVLGFTLAMVWLVVMLKRMSEEEEKKRNK